MEFGYKAQINVLFILLKSKVGAKRCKSKQKVGAKRCKNIKNTNQGVLIWLYNSSNSLLLI